MKHLIDTLEQACSESEEQRSVFLKLRQEMAATRAALKIIQSPGPE